MMIRRLPLRWAGMVAGALLGTLSAFSATGKTTPGYLEQVLQWTVQAGETCSVISESLYGSAEHAVLLKRYNQIQCREGQSLKEGLVLVVPESVTELPPASLQSLTPTVRAKAPGSSWEKASPQMPLFKWYSVNTLQDARADIRFLDRTNVYLSEHTLVVIYGSAKDSPLASGAAPNVELEEGELRAGLAALRNGVVAVATKGGGHIEASSSETVLRRQSERTTVSVFDGQATVHSAGEVVSVPKDYGTSFVAKAPPKPPRPLPSAPNWLGSRTPTVVLAPDGNGTVYAAWKPVPKAKEYRVEVSLDSRFETLVARELTSADVRAFQGENMPAGQYYVRVQAIDHEDFLGIATSARSVRLVSMSLQEGRIQGDRLELSPYAKLSFKAKVGVFMAMDDGGFSEVPEVLDVSQVRPRRLRFRAGQDGEPTEVAIDYRPLDVKWTVTESQDHTTALIRISVGALGGLDLMGAVRPTLKAHFIGEAEPYEVPLNPMVAGTLIGELSLGGRRGSVAFELQDLHGEVIGRAESLFPEGVLVATVPLPIANERHFLGLTLPPQSAHPLGTAEWWSPGLRSSVAVGGSGTSDGDNSAGQGVLRAEGVVGDFAVTARLSSSRLRAFNTVRVGEAGERYRVDRRLWLGGRWGILQRRGEGVELAVAARAAVPIVRESSGAQLEPSFAIGGPLGDFAWVANVGGRFALEKSSSEASLPDAQLDATLGLTADTGAYLRWFSVLDGHWLDAAHGRKAGGMSVGLEVGSKLFGSVAMRASPWERLGGHWNGQFAIGLREK